jgi:hypothetical protein
LSKLRNSILAGSMALYMAACTTVPLMSIVKLSSVNMSSTLPEDIRVAFITPKILRVKQGDLFMGVHLRTGDGSIDVQKKLDLLLDKTTPPPVVLASVGPDDNVNILKLRPEDVALFKGLQKAVSDSKQAGRKGSLDINFGSKACAESEIKGPLFVSAFIKTSELSDFILLLNKANVTELAKEAGQDAKIRTCEK